MIDFTHMMPESRCGGRVGIAVDGVAAASPPLGVDVSVLEAFASVLLALIRKIHYTTTTPMWCQCECG